MRTHPLTRTSLALVLALALLVATPSPRPSHALADGGALAATLLPASQTAGGFVLGSGAAGVLLPVAGAVLVGGGIGYVGYRVFNGEGWPWDWQNGDPGAEISGWSTADWELAGCSTDGDACALQEGARHPRVATVNVPAGTDPDTVHVFFEACEGGGRTAFYDGNGAWVDSGSNSKLNACLGNITVEVLQVGVMWSWVDDGLQADGEPTFGGDPTAQAVITTTAECTELGTSVTRTVTASSEPYSPTDPVPLAPSVACAHDERLTDLEIERIVPGTDVEPEPLAEPMVLPDPSEIPDHVPLEWQEEYGDCVEMVPAPCQLELEDTERSTETVPFVCTPEDCYGWQYDPNRDSRYACAWVTPGGDRIPLPLLECYVLQWDYSPEQGYTTRTPPTSGEPVLDTPTQTGEPPGTPQPSTDCRGGAEDPNQGFVSRVVFRGVVCALEWAFVPDPVVLEQTVTDPLLEAINSTMPFALIGIPWPVIADAFSMEQGCDGHIWRFPPEPEPGGELDHLPDDFFMGIPCEPPWNHTVPMNVMRVAVVLGVAWGMWNLAGSAVGGPRDGAVNTQGGAGD